MNGDLLVAVHIVCLGLAEVQGFVCCECNGPDNRYYIASCVAYSSSYEKKREKSTQDFLAPRPKLA